MTIRKKTGVRRIIGSVRMSLPVSGIIKSGVISAILLLSVGLAADLKGEDAKSLDDLKLPPVAKKEWVFKSFPILAWWPPPGTKTLEDFKRYKEAGFTIYPANPDAGFDNALKLAKKAGIPVMGHRTLQGFDVPRSVKPVVFDVKDSNVVGWITHDEPGWYKPAVRAATEVNELMRSDPVRWAFFNNLPLNRPQKLPVLEIAEAALRNGMPVLSYDNYVIMENGTDRTKEHFDNLRDARKLSLKYDVPFWAFALTTQHRAYRRPSESDIRWKQFTNLAYGAKGLWYFCYWGPHRWDKKGWDTRSIVDSATGEPTDLYHQVKAINETVLAMGDILLGLTSEDVAHTNPPQGHAASALVKGTHWITDIKAKDALIGFFVNDKGDRYALVVNKLHGKGKSSKETADTIELTFGANVKEVQAVHWLDGKPGKLVLKGKIASLRISGGTGVLIKAIERSRLGTDVTFQTTDVKLQKLFDVAEAKSASNIVQFTPTMKVLVEGGGYGNAWIETQPMGGEMYAKRHLEVALNNQLVFMHTQRADGRLPGMVINTKTGLEKYESKTVPPEMIWMPKAKILADFEMFQGYCFPTPAWKMYFWAGKDKGYLRKLYKALEAHDAYLWRTRDSNGDGILETWCVWDTGEDGSSRLNTRRAPYRWPFDFPPNPKEVENPNRYWSDVPKPEQVLVPFASMDVMSYSYDGRNTLAKIARELGNGRAAFWEKQADEVRKRLVKGLWDPNRHACFDRDRNNKPLDELIHNNLRVMYHGTFTQSMADTFIKHHLLNPQEFWTPLPLPSIAFNDPLYRNHAGNDWSGQPQGLTWQRAIGALENYGHFAEVTLLGQKLIPVLIGNDYKFSQQLDPQTGKDESKGKRDGYGPMMLAVLEYLSRMYGIHLDVANSNVWWSSLGDKEFTYRQKWGEQTWSMTSTKGILTARLNGKEIFSCTEGVRVVTDLKGNISQVVGIDPTSQSLVLQTGNASHKWVVKPNHVYRFADGELIPLRVVPFDYPYHQEDSSREKGK